MSEVSIPEVHVVEVIPTRVWYERVGFFGDMAVKMQHKGYPEFTFCTLHYDHTYTSNAHQHQVARAIVEMLGGDTKEQA